MTINPDRFLAVATAARRLEVCAETVRVWIRAEKIAFVKTPTGRYFVSASTVEQLRLDRGLK